MAATVTVTNQVDTIRINDDNNQIDLFKYLVSVSTNEANTAVIIRYRNTVYAQYNATQFSSPSGSAQSIQSQIAAMLALS